MDYGQDNHLFEDWEEMGHDELPSKDIIRNRTERDKTRRIRDAQDKRRKQTMKSLRMSKQDRQRGDGRRGRR